jgi:hypothetical protein
MQGSLIHPSFLAIEWFERAQDGARAAHDGFTTAPLTNI